MRRTLSALLVHKKLPWLLAALAVALTAPSLAVGLQLDDYLHEQLILQGNLAAVLMRLFLFWYNDPATTTGWMELGILPWWTLPQSYLAFWRPLAALTHWLDYQLWPDLPWLMHLHNLLWFGALIFATTSLYRHLFGEISVARQTPLLAAGLAALLYAVDEAHGFPAGWIANRNAIMSALFGVLTLLAYHRWRRAGWRPGLWLAPPLLALGLLSAEAAAATAGYLLAYALFLDASRWRWPALLPAFFALLLWRLVYRGLGYGVWGSAYADPLQNPLYYLQVALERGPLLLAGQLTPLPAEIYNFLYPPFSTVYWWLAVAGMTIIGPAVWSLRRDPLARFFAAGMLLSLLPACGAPPANRLLFFAGLGAMGLVAQVVTRPWESKSRFNRAVTGLLLIFHLVLAPLLLPLNALGALLFSRVEPAASQLTSDPSLARQTLVIVNAPSSFYSALLPFVRRRNHQPAPARVRLLSASLYPVELRRLDARSLAVRPTGGYVLGLEAVFRGRSHDLALGQQVVLPGITAQVTQLTADGRPAEVNFMFDTPLEAGSLRWLLWQNGRFEPITLPAVGERLRLAPALGP